MDCYCKSDIVDRNVSSRSLMPVYLVIVAFAFNNYIAVLFSYLFGLGKLSNVLLDLFFVFLFFYPKVKLQKEHVPLYFFSLLLLCKSAVFLIGAGIDIVSFYLEFSFFRRVVLPFGAFMYFFFKLTKHEDIGKLNRFMYKLFIVVVFLQNIDFLLMNFSVTYHDQIINYANAIEEIFIGEKLSHIPLFGFQYVRCFGIGLNYHSSSLYVLMLYAFNIQMKNPIPFWLHLLTYSAVTASGSVQSIGLYVLMLLLCVNHIYRHKLFFLLALAFAAVISLEVFIGVALPGFGSIYMIELLYLSVDAVMGYFGTNINQFLWGIGGLAAIGEQWLVEDETLPIGDIGIFRLLSEGGAIALIFYLLLVLWFFYKYVSHYKGEDPLPVKASVTAIIIGFGSLVHYPVIFSRNNVILYMLFLAIIAAQYHRRSAAKAHLYR
jgi:hypothetical protein